MFQTQRKLFSIMCFFYIHISRILNLNRAWSAIATVRLVCCDVTLSQPSVFVTTCACCNQVWLSCVCVGPCRWSSWWRRTSSLPSAAFCRSKTPRCCRWCSTAWKTCSSWPGTRPAPSRRSSRSVEVGRARAPLDLLRHFVCSSPVSSDPVNRSIIQKP